MKLILSKDSIKKEYINITEHSGKMQGIPSISTNKYTNCNCLKMSKLNGCICSKCYVDGVAKRYPNLIQALQHNTEVITARILTGAELQVLSKHFANTLICRFEAFGDLNNETQIINYSNIARACKYTKFALFTKQFGLLLNWFRNGGRLPNNITVVLSTPYINTEIYNEKLELFKAYHERTIIFSVVDDPNNKKINCGGRKCLECRNCYDAENPHNVTELLK